MVFAAYKSTLRIVYHISPIVGRYLTALMYYTGATIRHVATRNISFWVVRRKIIQICAAKEDIVLEVQRKEGPTVIMKKARGIIMRS